MTDALEEDKAHVRELLDMGWTERRLLEKMKAELEGIKLLCDAGIISKNGAEKLATTCRSIIAALGEHP
jgi:hypothetical protein